MAKFIIEVDDSAIDHMLGLVSEIALRRVAVANTGVAGVAVLSMEQADDVPPDILCALGAYVGSGCYADIIIGGFGVCLDHAGYFQDSTPQPRNRCV